MGEPESIALAADLKADVVIIDEQEGRQLATLVGIPVTGVLGILLKAKQSGQIPAPKPEIESLRNKARFFISSSLEAKLLAAARERRDFRADSPLNVEGEHDAAFV